MEFTSTEVRFEHGMYKYIATLMRTGDTGEGYCLERHYRYKSSAKLKLPCGTLYTNGWFRMRMHTDAQPVYFKTLDDIKEFMNPQLEKKLSFLTLPRVMVSC